MTADLPPFDEVRLRALVANLPSLSPLSPPQAAVDELAEMLATAGVAFVLTPEFAGTRLSGAAHWPTPWQPVVQLSGRYRSDDQFWFTVVHETWHLLDTPGKDFADEDPDERSASADAIEARGDALAREALVPTAALERLLSSAGYRDRHAIRALAIELGIAPGLVVGRLQRDGHIGYEALNDLKRPFHTS